MENKNKKIIFCLILFPVFYFLLSAFSAQAASFFLGPAAGTFTVGSAFEVSIFLDTQGESVNTIDTTILFPPDKLQLISSSVGQSVVGLWLFIPKFNNQTGKIEFKGGIPGGIKTDNGLITKLSFRARGTGSVFIKFSPDSKILLNDGRGTDALKDIRGAIYNIILPPPAGPIVTSSTHSDQSKWYPNQNAVLIWVPENGAEGYSYILSDEPGDIPDDISEGEKQSVAYKNLGDGSRYFHIKSLRKGFWGGVTHFALNIDTTPPADFSIEIIPDKKTTRKHPIIEFSTSDMLSGISHYELKIIPLEIDETVSAESGAQINQLFAEAQNPLFIEIQSPYVPPELALGTYDVIIRAYDKAGNFREVSERLAIVKTVFQFIGDRGLEIKGFFTIPWLWFWLMCGVLIALLVYLARFFRKWHRKIEIQKYNKELPPEVREKLDELKEYRKKYENLVIFLLFLSAGLLFFNGKIALSGELVLNPPFITTVSRNISNEEIFYVGGKTDVAQSEVSLYLQNLQTGETFSQTVVSDRNGEWFYRHNSFLLSGNYLLWSQHKVGENLSPPSPQIQMAVRQTALQFGASRISYETFYLAGILIFGVAVAGLLIYIIFHAYQGRKKHKRFWKEVKEAEESVRRGFAVLRRDIEAELAIVKKAKLKKALSEEEGAKERQLFKDLEWVEKYIGREIWDIGETEHID